MTYIGMSWIDEDLRAAIADAEDDQAAFAVAATALVGVVREGLGKVNATLAGLVREQARAASALEGIEAELGPSGSVADIGGAIREVNVRPEDVGLVPAADYDPHHDEPGRGGR